MLRALLPAVEGGLWGGGGSVPHLSAVRSPALSALLSAVLGAATVLF